MWFGLMPRKILPKFHGIRTEKVEITTHRVANAMYEIVIYYLRDSDLLHVWVCLMCCKCAGLQICIFRPHVLEQPVSWGWQCACSCGESTFSIDFSSFKNSFDSCFLFGFSSYLRRVLQNQGQDLVATSVVCKAGDHKTRITRKIHAWNGQMPAKQATF